jgi:hypothetical protein
MGMECKRNSRLGFGMATPPNGPIGPRSMTALTIIRRHTGYESTHRRISLQMRLMSKPDFDRPK